MIINVRYLIRNAHSAIWVEDEFNVPIALSAFRDKSHLGSELLTFKYGLDATLSFCRLPAERKTKKGFAAVRFFVCFFTCWLFVCLVVLFCLIVGHSACCFVSLLVCLLACLVCLLVGWLLCLFDVPLSACGFFFVRWCLKRNGA